MKRLTYFAFALLLLFASFGLSFGAPSPAPALASPHGTPSVKGAVISLGPGQMRAAEAPGYTGPTSVATLDSGTDGSFNSDVIEAPLPFTHVGIRYAAKIPEHASIDWEIKGSIDGKVWTKWYPVEDDDDLPVGKNGERNTQVFGLRENGNRTLLHYFQARATLTKNPSGESPSITSLNIVFIDPTLAPETAQSTLANGLTALNISPSTASATATTYKVYLPLIFKQYPPVSIPKPAVISRVGWACPDGEVSPGWPPDYQKVTHIIVHHTATSNAAVDWAEEVRVVWYYHTYQVPNSDGTYGWGDIGYNYLIDPNGFIYEGRAGGDDVVGGHALQYNWGSLGVALLGNYASTSPSAAAQNSLVNLLSWKANQRGINPLLMSTYFVDKYVPTVAGHRDVLSTECPGQIAYNLLPQIRQRISNRLSSSSSP